MRSTPSSRTSPSASHDARPSAQRVVSRAGAHVADAVLRAVYRRVATQQPTDAVSLQNACRIRPTELASALATLSGLGLVRLVRPSSTPEAAVTARLTFAGLAWATACAAARRTARHPRGARSGGPGLVRVRETVQVCLSRVA
jgi:hypothetical protein